MMCVLLLNLHNINTLNECIRISKYNSSAKNEGYFFKKYCSKEVFIQMLSFFRFVYGIDRHFSYLNHPIHITKGRLNIRHITQSNRNIIQRNHQIQPLEKYLLRILKIQFYQWCF